MEQSKVLDALSAMAHETRLSILRMLVRAGPEGLRAGTIGAAVAAPASRLSFHLATLERAGLIGSRRVARNVIYCARTDAVGAVMAYLLHDCCAGDPEVGARCRNGGRSAEDQGVAVAAAPSGMLKI